MNKITIILLTIIVLISFFLNTFKQNISPPCFNSDEAAVGYNAYSILKTGGDEYGNFMPLRLKSFGDFKMPVYSYLSVPFISVFGLNETGTRALNSFVSILFPIAIFFITIKLFKDKKIALVSSFLVSVSLGLHTVGRHAHEAYLSAFLLTITILFFLKVLEKQNKKNVILFCFFLLLSLFGYHSNRIIAIYLFIILTILLIKGERKLKFFIIVFFITFLAFAVSDVIYNPTRINNLLFFNNQGFNLKVQELKTEGGFAPLYNSVTIGLKDIIGDHLTYFSPQFLVLNGDQNTRFGYEGMGIMGIIEYIFLFIGIYYLFKNKERWRYFLIGLLLFSPLSSSLSWAKGSLTRSLFFLIPIFILSSYGFINLLKTIGYKRYYKLVLFLIIISFGYFNFFNWDFYLFHYPKRAVVIRSWQCGYKELGKYINKNYDKYDKFYITKDVGMPYIFQLFYLKYPPLKYQRQAQLTPPDEYGFGQVEQFDKFVFQFISPLKVKNAVVIGSQNDFTNYKKENPDFDLSKTKIIKKETEEMFRIYESN